MSEKTNETAKSLSKSFQAVQSMDEELRAAIRESLKTPMFDFGSRLDKLPDNISGTITSYNVKLVNIKTGEKDKDGNLRLDEKGKPLTKPASFLEFTTSNEEMRKTSIPVEKLKPLGFDWENTDLEGALFTHKVGFDFDLKLS